MSTFSVNVVRIRAIEPIPNADAIELAVVGDYRSVVKRGQYAPGDLAVYIPEASVLPIGLIRSLNLEGRLAGSDHNRVKAIRLRGCLSQGILYPVQGAVGDPHFITLPAEDGSLSSVLGVVEGQNVMSDLGIVKWEPPIPTQMSGELYNAGTHLTLAYDIENYKAHPSILVDGEEVVMTEKLHGTFVGIGILPEQDWDDIHYRRKFVVFSKGYGSKGLCFKDSAANDNNLYVRTLQSLGVFERIEAFIRMIEDDGGTIDSPTFFFGEIFGQGVQDLAYGAQQPQFRAFDIAVGYRNDERYFTYDEMVACCDVIGVDTVPLIYRGPFSRDTLMQHTRGTETLSGKGVNIREGVVVKPTTERRHSDIGRVILKSVSEDYILRRDGTEYQ